MSKDGENDRKAQRADKLVSFPISCYFRCPLSGMGGEEEMRKTRRTLHTDLQISTCIIHLLRYVRPSVPHTASCSLPQRCSQFDPYARRHCEGLSASVTPATDTRHTVRNKRWRFSEKKNPTSVHNINFSKTVISKRRFGESSA